jgi:hypothetical protein
MTTAFKSHPLRNYLVMLNHEQYVDVYIRKSQDVKGMEVDLLMAGEEGKESFTCVTSRKEV